MIEKWIQAYFCEIKALLTDKKICEKSNCFHVAFFWKLLQCFAAKCLCFFMNISIQSGEEMHTVWLSNLSVRFETCNLLFVLPKSSALSKPFPGNQSNFPTQYASVTLLEMVEQGREKTLTD